MIRENKLVYMPFREMLLDRGWLVTKTHGNEYQKALPDTRIAHKKYGCKWVEFKVIDRTPKGSPIVHLSRSQKDNWPLWVAHGEKIWVVAAEDFRGVRNKGIMEKWYNRVCFGEANVHLFLHYSTIKYGIIP